MVEDWNIVDTYINADALTIDETKTLTDARKLMARENTDFLVVTRQDKPVYILKYRKLIRMDPKSTISDAFGADKEEKRDFVGTGSLWMKALKKFKYRTVIVVLDSSKKKTKICGAIKGDEAKRQMRRSIEDLKSGSVGPVWRWKS